MIPIDQEIVTAPLEGPPGDCFAACIASILEIDLATVPKWGWTENDAGEVIAIETWTKYRGRLFDWLRERGWIYREMQVPTEGAPWDDWRSELGFHIRSGPSYRTNGETDHSVVFWGDELAHDPAPSKKGIMPRRDGDFVNVGFLIPLNPAQDWRS
jgi:hypothetical protein